MGIEPIKSSTFFKHICVGELMGSRCLTCGALYLPPRPICKYCGTAQMAPKEASGKGKILTFTIIYGVPSAMLKLGYSRENPYCVGLVQLEEGPVVSAQLIGLDMLHPDPSYIGASVSAKLVQRNQDASDKEMIINKNCSLVFQPVCQ
jgi:uncharacterized protein